MNWLNKLPIAHRGLHSNANNIYENTKESFLAAVNENYAIECDVVLSKDHEVVVFHDENLKRLCNLDKNVSSLTMNELRSLKIYESNSNIISLDEMLHVVSAHVPIIIEIKGKFTPFIEERIQEIIRSYRGPIALKTFNLKSVEWLIKFLPYVYKGLVIDSNTNNFEAILDLNIDFVSCDIEFIESNLVDRLKKKGLPIITWTVDNEDKKKKANLIADNIIFENIRP
ncbi:MAG: glycerophosphodiester phosphodiesterase family protein [Candidatus Pelagibacterales bacterium]|mgnify:FL=1|jgi:glycerophosphoryl diester phosphodiesterase|tara:strand:- start:191 stop:871 length:681 start_codon:yes stop_codon:yes gene_type:complete